MPLIIITGLPTSGKSTRAKQLEAYLTERIQSSQGGGSGAGLGAYRLHIISDQTQSIPRSAYDLSAEGQPAHTRSANASEKDARAATYAAAKRALGPRDVVVVDGLNYIKGWRYQLFCEARSAGTPSCVLQVGCAVERARAVNERRLERRAARRRRAEGEGTAAGDGAGDVEPAEDRVADDEGEDDEEPYEPANWENLVYRYEEPNPMTRWDSPLFTLIWEDDEARTRQVFDSLWDAIAGGGKKVLRHKVTAQRDKDYGGDYLYMLEKETQDIVKKILELQGDEGGGEIRIPRGGEGGGDDELVVELPGRKVGLPQLQRYKRAFVGLNRGGIGLESVGSQAVGGLRESFVGYLNDALEKDE